MQYLIHYTLVLTLTVLGVSLFQWLKNERKYAFWIGLALALGLEGGTRHFLTMNLGRNIGIHSFDFTGIYIVMAVSALITVISLIVWLRTKKLMPWLIVAALAGLQILISILVMSSFSVATPNLPR
jgi:hypothetical protein